MAKEAEKKALISEISANLFDNNHEDKSENDKNLLELMDRYWDTFPANSNSNRPRGFLSLITRSIDFFIVNILFKNHIK